MYVHPHSAARMACSKVNRVVARVLIPRAESARQACRPSHVETTLMQRRDRGKLGEIREVRAEIPIVSIQEAFTKSFNWNCQATMREGAYAERFP